MMPPHIWMLTTMVVGVVLGAKDAAQTQVRFQTTHKFGTQLLNDFLKERFGNEPTLLKQRVAPKINQPTVTVLRDIFDATVSGYLYHKSGRECWKDDKGFPNPISDERGHMKNQVGNDWLHRSNWSNVVTTVPVDIFANNNDTTTITSIRFPDYDLCEALESTNETIGMGIYLEFARKTFYNSVFQLLTPTLRHDNLDSCYYKYFQNNSLFVCFEDMAEFPNETERRIRSWMRSLPPPDASTKKKKKQKNSRRRGLADYSGSHATDHDPELRARLRAIAIDLDCQYFHCQTQDWNNVFNCTAEEERTSKDNASEEQEEESLVKGHAETTICPERNYLRALMLVIVLMEVLWCWYSKRWHQHNPPLDDKNNPQNAQVEIVSLIGNDLEAKCQ